MDNLTRYDVMHKYFEYVLGMRLSYYYRYTESQPVIITEELCGLLQTEQGLDLNLVQQLEF